MAQKQKSVYELNYDCKIYDFMRWYCLAFILSGLLFISAITVIVVRGFNWGLDFTGGTVIELNLEKAVNLDHIRCALISSGFTNSIVQNFGNNHDIIVRLPLEQNRFNQNLTNKVLSVIKQLIGQNVIVERVEFVGPSIGSDLIYSGSIALLLALACILIYVSFRFEWRLATGTVLALVHDVVITLGLLSLFYIEIDLTIIASLMSVIGYSLNDSIVISDRIRENFRKIIHGSAYDIFNVSLTQTISRTIITSATTLLVMLILLIFGGVMLHGFSMTLLIGVLTGTVSSIYVASALALKFGMKPEYLLQLKTEKEGEYY